ncbi:MAG: zf-HC2 domain-containing protein [Deltaproteobacteria bacterium]|nr:zf-HC2 domain-containing protein [Deltaproteobacteria bacterium]
MRCGKVGELLTGLIEGALSPAEQEAAEVHLRGCAACRGALEQERRGKAAVRQAMQVPVPAGLAARIQAALDEARPQQAGVLGWLSQAPLAPQLGAMVAAVLAALWVGRGLSVPLPAPWLLALGAAWTGIFGIAFTMLASSDGRAEGRRPSLAVALVAGGAAVLLLPVLPVSRVIEACMELAEMGGLTHRAVVAAAAIGYGAVPLVVATLALSLRLGRLSSRGRSLAVGGYLAVVGPALLLQCLPLALEMAAIWLGGMLAGGFLGGYAGQVLSQRVAMA